jgi:RNA polymerase sigma factor (sigma-70 family)
MKPNVIIGMCKGLARRYKSQSHYDDLVGEGVLRCYEILDKEPDAPPVKLYREANRKMHDYFNLDTFPVSVPASDVSRRLVRDGDSEDFGDTHWTNEAIEYLRNVLKSDIIPFDTFALFNETSENSYEDKEFYEKLNAKIQEGLTSDELLHVHMRFSEDMTQAEIGEFFGITQQAVDKREVKLFKKLRGIVTNLQQSRNIS